MDEERLPQKYFKLDRKRERLKTRWEEGVLRTVEECGLRYGDYEDRFRWRLGERDVTIHHRTTTYM
jgi:hypothetical protein